ncbi:MAG: dihydrodipicolinate synthase family protein [Terriglobales bacterium]
MTIQGVYSVLPTPFDPAGALDLASLRRVVERFLQAGVNGFTALGVTGEVARLTGAERLEVLDAVVQQVAGRVPVVAGATAGGSHGAIDYARQAQAAGCAAVMVSPPRLNKLNSAAVVAHFQALATAVDLPIVVQDYPPISGYAMEPELLARIVREAPAAQTIKLEDPPTPRKIAALRRLCGDGVRIFGGLGGTFLLEELLAGCDGAMTGFAYPEILLAITQAFHQGRQDRAADVFYRYVPLMRFEFQEGIGVAIRKEVLRRRGLLAHATVRPPGPQLDTGTAAQLDRLLTWLQQTYREDAWI